MVRKVSLLLAFWLLVLALLPGMVYASYGYYIPITVFNNDSSEWSGPVLVTLNHSQLVELGYITSTGLDTELVEGSSISSHSVASAHLGLFIPSILGTQSRTSNYRLGVDPSKTDLPLIVGYEGNVTITDHADLELGSNSTLEVYPTVVSINTSQETSVTTQHTVDLPLNLAVGDLVLVLFAARDKAHTVTWPAGWNELVLDYSSDVRTSGGVIYRVIDGSEGSSITVTTNSTQWSASIAAHIVDYQGVPEIQAASWSSGTHQPNPPNLNVSWDNPTLWLAGLCGHSIGTVNIYPSTYTDGTYWQYGSLSIVAFAQKELWASSEDPGVYGLSNWNTEVVPWTIGIQGDSQELGAVFRLECSGWISGGDLILKEDSFSLNYSGTTLNATIHSSPPKSVAYSVSEGHHHLTIWSDGSNFGLDVDYQNVATTNITGVSVPDNANDWYLEFDYLDYFRLIDLDDYIFDYLIIWGYPMVDWVEGYSSGYGEHYTYPDYRLVANSNLTDEESVRTWVTDSPIDFTFVDEIWIDWENTGEWAIQNRAYLTGSTGKMEDFRNWDFIAYRSKNFARTADFISTVGIEGEYYVKIYGVDLGGAAYNTSCDLTIHSLRTGSYGSHVLYQPKTIISGSSLTDMSGSGHTGTINWGSNPSTIEVTVGGLEPAVSPTAPGTDLGGVPDVLPPPGSIDMGATTGAAGTGLPLQANFQRAATSLDWSLPVTYSVFFMIVAIVVGVGALVASGTIWGWVAGFGATAALFGAVTDSTGSLVMPIWLTILCVLFAIFSGYVWRYT